MKFRRQAACCVAVALGACPAMAGPHFRTDDPEPIDYKYYEFYTFFTGLRATESSAREPVHRVQESSLRVRHRPARNHELAVAVLKGAHDDP